MTRTAMCGLLLATVVCGGILVASASGASRRQSASRVPVPRGFVGMVVDEPIWPDPYVQLSSQLSSMVDAGVQSIRITIDWAHTQPYEHWREVPRGQRPGFVNVGGVPTDFSELDMIVGLAAEHGLSVLPTILGAPPWDGVQGKGAIVRIPRSDTPFAAFAKALVERYGPRGAYWIHREGSKLPIVRWQIWNEPNIVAFWPAQPFERRYVALLKAAHDAIKSADPGAQVVLAGMPNYSWLDLARIYRVAGARDAFDVVGVHPYTKTPSGVIKILGYVRRVMDRHGDAAKPLLADEISWPSSIGKTTHDTGYDFATTEAGQARNIAAVLPMLARDRSSLGLLGFYYYDWAGQDRPNYLAFDFSGLLHLQDGAFTPKPAFGAFRRGALRIEGCRADGKPAIDCVRVG